MYKVGDWVIARPNSGMHSTFVDKPSYVHSVRWHYLSERDGGSNRVQMLTISTGPDDKRTAGYYSTRFKLYQRDVVTKTFNGRKIG
jgi:hypothetical protein